jgi:spoIIIJ-associated protein
MKEEKLKDIVKKFLSYIPFDTEVGDVVATEASLKVAIKSSDPERLIGANGATLSAINHLVRRMAEKAGIEESISIDVNKYREKEEERIRESAKLLGEQVLAFKQEVEMEPMGPYERLLVHNFFVGHPQLYTESRGEGPSRRVVIVYGKKESVPPTPLA